MERPLTARKSDGRQHVSRVTEKTVHLGEVKKNVARAHLNTVQQGVTNCLPLASCNPQKGWCITHL